MRISDWSSDVCSSDLRQIVDGAELIASFEEGHSHATTHLIQVEDLALEDTVRAARSLVIVDDECSTGNTYVAVANAMLETMPNLELIATCRSDEPRVGNECVSTCRSR